MLFYFCNPKTGEVENIVYPLRSALYPKWTLQELIRLDLFETLIKNSANDVGDMNDANENGEKVEIPYEHKAAMMEIISGEFTKIELIESVGVCMGDAKSGGDQQIVNIKVVNRAEIESIHNSLNYLGYYDMCGWYRAVVIEPLYEWMRNTNRSWVKATYDKLRKSQRLEPGYMNDMACKNPMFSNEVFDTNLKGLFNLVDLCENPSVTNEFLYNFRGMDSGNRIGSRVDLIKDIPAKSIAYRNAAFFRENIDLILLYRPAIYQYVNQVDTIGKLEIAPRKYDYEVLRKIAESIPASDWGIYDFRYIPETLIDESIERHGLDTRGNTSRNNVAKIFADYPVSDAFRKKYGMPPTIDQGALKVYTADEVRNTEYIDVYRWLYMMRHPHLCDDEAPILAFNLIGLSFDTDHMPEFYSIFPISDGQICRNVRNINANFDRFLLNPHIDIDILMNFSEKVRGAWIEDLFMNRFQMDKYWILRWMYTTRVQLLNFDCAWKKILAEIV